MQAFIKNALPIGSKFLVETYDFDVSPATVRSEMADLEDQGYIMQPHTSAGRVPTARAYRAFVNEMQVTDPLMLRARNDLLSARRQLHLKQARERVHETVSMLSMATRQVSFATVPDRERVFYFGLSQLLREPEFAEDPARATEVIEALETRFYDFLTSLAVGSEGAVYIGEENLLPQFASCSLLALPYSYKGFSGVIGLLGSTRMDYAYNLAALRSAVALLS